MRGRRIDERTEQQVMELYRHGLSERKVAKELAISNGCVHTALVRNDVPRRSVTKYLKTNFSGNPAEKARIIGFIEDCDARPIGKQTRVSTTTTHPGQMKLFNDIFGGYGHTAKYPTYNSQNCSYQWKVYADLNTTFAFVTEYKRNKAKYLAEISEDGHEITRIASLTDAEGSVGIQFNKGYPRPVLSIANNNRQLLEWTKRTIGGHITPNHHGYKLRSSGDEAVEVIRELPILHEEKTAAKELILRHFDNGGIGLPALSEYRALRLKIEDEVRSCTLQARLEYIRRHGRPHPKDADKTIPRN